MAFEVDPADIHEERTVGEAPIDYAQRLARDTGADRPGSPSRWRVVLGADTVVVIYDHLLEKPTGAHDAVRMLRLLSGRTHQVITGVCLMAIGFESTVAEMTQVTFAQISRGRDKRIHRDRRANGQKPAHMELQGTVA